MKNGMPNTKICKFQVLSGRLKMKEILKGYLLTTILLVSVFYGGRLIFFTK